MELMPMRGRQSKRLQINILAVEAAVLSTGCVISSQHQNSRFCGATLWSKARL